jgi:V/A-type H+-transporting ATPase subunit I
MYLKGEGIRGLIELPSIFSNTLSYARLMAIGLSSVKLAEVINEMAAEMFHGGGFLILAGVLILALGHIINIGIGMLGSFLHSLRLHYVEFFTKFFHGGAKKYSPFGAKQ